jgi:hypothetical protein
MMKKNHYAKANNMGILGITAEDGDTIFSPWERIWFRPTLEIIGPQSGYKGIDGLSNNIP